MNHLAQVPVPFLRASGAEFDEYVYTWIAALQHLWFGRPQTWDALVSAIQDTAPAQARIASTELMLKILYPPLELFQLYLRRENQAFTDSLTTALTWHKEYWMADETRLLSGDGLVALGPLAIAYMAYDAGMPIGVESAYLPKHLLQRSWLGEFPT